MPPYEGILSIQEIEAVAHYVSISATLNKIYIIKNNEQRYLF